MKSFKLEQGTATENLQVVTVSKKLLGLCVVVGGEVCLCVCVGGGGGGGRGGGSGAWISVARALNSDAVPKCTIVSFLYLWLVKFKMFFFSNYGYISSLMIAFIDFIENSFMSFVSFLFEKWILQATTTEHILLYSDSKLAQVPNKYFGWSVRPTFNVKHLFCYRDIW